MAYVQMGSAEEAVSALVVCETLASSAQQSLMLSCDVAKSCNVVHSFL